MKNTILPLHTGQVDHLRDSLAYRLHGQIQSKLPHTSLPICQEKGQHCGVRIYGRPVFMSFNPWSLLRLPKRVLITASVGAAMCEPIL